MKTLLRNFTILLVAIFSLSGCMKQELDEIRSEQEKQAKRLAEIEAWIVTANNNISALQTLTQAMQDNDYVTGITPVMENAEVTGYTITFTKSKSITIYHGKNGTNGVDGKDGKDGNNGTDGTNGKDGTNGTTPIIGLAKDTNDPYDSNYYWTQKIGDAAPTWIIDSNGNKIPANGMNTSAPKLRIYTWSNEWEISTDGGLTWTTTGVKATGDQGDAIFMKDGIDNTNADYVEFTLADGTKLQVAKYQELALIFEQPDAMENGATHSVPFTIKGDVTIIVVVSMIGTVSGWQADVDMANSKFLVSVPVGAVGSKATAVIIAGNNQKTIMYSMNLQSK